MNVKGIIVEQIDWDGTSKSLTMQPDYRLGDLWVAFPTDYDEPRTGPFYFQSSSYEKKYNTNVAECKARKITNDSFYQTDGIFTFKTVWHNIPTEYETLTYYALYLPEYAVPIRVNLFDPRNVDKKFKRTVIKDNQSPRYIVYLQCSSKFGTFNFNLECQFKQDKEGFSKSDYIDEYQTGLYSQPEQWQYLMNDSDRTKTQKFFAEQIVINKGKFKQSFKPNTAGEKKKFKLEFIHWFTIISAVCAVIVLLFGNNIWGRMNGKPDSENKNDTSTSILKKQNRDTIIANIQLPYLDNVPILDKGIFVKHYYTHLVFGGVNIDTISIGARTKTGESIEISKSDNELQLDISKEPFIEFEYKGTLYSIETIGQLYSFDCILKENIKQTLTLKNYHNL